jgi:glycosyltransferase involved in cell wall biosynthesis
MAAISPSGAKGCSRVRPAPRLFVDVSTLVRFSGPAVGTVRVEHELARQAAPRGGQPVAFDPAARRFRLLDPRWADRLLGWDGLLDPAHGEPRPRRPRRHDLFLALERRRLAAPDGPVGRLLGAAQRALHAARPPGFRLADAAGRRIPVLPADMAFGPPAAFAPGDLLLSAANDWDRKDLGAIAAAKRETGFRLAVLCYDLIPLTRPEFFPPEVRAPFGRHWRRMLAEADRVIVNSRAVAGDVAALRAAEGLPPVATPVVPLGCDPPRAATAPLPGGLSPDRFALFVSTIEPRKNHALLIEVWRRLLARGVPQQTGFRLVFVGRPGWMVDEVLAELADPSRFGGTLLHLPRADDAVLSSLYAAAGFCLYPSRTEGFGLPVVEAFAHGRALIASTGGAVPEAAAGLAPCLDPDDAAAWEAEMARLMQDGAARRAAEARVVAGYRPRGWAEVTADLIRAATTDNAA